MMAASSESTARSGPLVQVVCVACPNPASCPATPRDTALNQSLPRRPESRHGRLDFPKSTTILESQLNTRVLSSV